MLLRHCAHAVLAVFVLASQAPGQNPTDAQRIADLEKAVNALTNRVNGVEKSFADLKASVGSAHDAHVGAVAKAFEAHKAVTTDAVGALAKALQERVPIGTVLTYAGPRPEELEALGWLVCDGREMPLNAQNEALFRVIGTSYGGKGADPAKPDSFCLPDYRSRFLRGVNPNDTEAGRLGDEKRLAPRPDLDLKGNTGYAVGSLQDDSLQQHTHADAGHGHSASISPNPHSHSYREPGGGGSSAKQEQGGLVYARTSNEALSVTVNDGTANLAGAIALGAGAEIVRISPETRPRNVYVYLIIRVR